MADGALVFHEDWYPAPRLALLMAAAGETCGRPGANVEIGCWEGRSTIALARALAGEPLHAVDHWQGWAGDATEALARSRDVERTFRENIRAVRCRNIVVHRQDWRVWAASWTRRIKFLHLDAAHDEQSVYACLIALRPLLTAGALVCGDDYHTGGVQAATAAALGAVESADGVFWRWTGR